MSRTSYQFDCTQLQHTLRCRTGAWCCSTEGRNLQAYHTERPDKTHGRTSLRTSLRHVISRSQCGCKLIRIREFSGNLTTHHRGILESKSIVHGCSNSRFWSLNTFGRALELEYLWVPFFPGPLITFGVLPEFLNTSVFWKWLFVDIMCSCRSFCLHVVFFLAIFYLLCLGFLFFLFLQTFVDFVSEKGGKNELVWVSNGFQLETVECLWKLIPRKTEENDTKMKHLQIITYTKVGRRITLGNLTPLAKSIKH